MSRRPRGVAPALLAYRLATGLFEPFAPLVLAARARRGKEDPSRRGERLGRASTARPPGPLLWLHGASVGEAVSLIPLIEALRRATPGTTLLVTSGTPTSAQVLAGRLPPAVLRQYLPIDAPRAARRFVEHWRPDLAVFVESEVWPNLLVAARGQGVRTALVSARLSPGSLVRWRRAGRAARDLFAGFRLVLAQDDEAAAGLVALGARDDGRLNLKRAADPPSADADALAMTRAAAAGRPVLLAASTHPGEDAIVLDALAALAAPALLIIAPRHPARAPAIMALAQARGLDASLRSQGHGFGVTRVYVADTLGELGLWLRLCDAALIAGSLLPGPGGHNPLEAARLRRPVLVGPHVEHWRSVYADLGDAVRTVADAGALARAWEAILADPAAGAGDRAALAQRLAGEANAALGPGVARLLALASAP